MKIYEVEDATNKIWVNLLLQSAKPKTDSCSYCCKSVDFRATPPECNDSLRESKTEDNLSYWSQQIKLSKYVGTSSSKPGKAIHRKDSCRLMKYNFGPLLNVDREVPFIEVSLDHYTTLLRFHFGPLVLWKLLAQLTDCESWVTE